MAPGRARDLFSGIVERRGEVASARDRPGGRELVVSALDGPGLAPWEAVEVGESIAVSGVCLTAAAIEGGGRTVRFDAVPETLSRTTLGRLAQGARVNLERSLRLGDRLGGHLVSGHIDGVGEVLLARREGDQVLFRIGAPASVLDFLIEKGSAAVDGISLTVIGVDRAAGWFSFAAIPHTLSVTTLGERRPGDPVNLEADPIGKWVLHGVRELGLPGRA